MLQVFYPSKKALKEAVGQSLRYQETSFFGEEYKPTGLLYVADGSPKRKWFAQVSMVEGKIAKVA
jgi:hypothetical protein